MVERKRGSMKALIVGLLLMGLGAGFLFAEEGNAQREGLKRWNKLAGSIADIPPQEAIELLGQGVRKTSRRDIYSIEGTVETAQKLKQVLLSIPGHAEYYRDRILAAQEEYLADRTSIWAGSKQNRYYSAMREAYATLAHLPSVETMRVFSELIDNDRVPPGNNSLPIAEQVAPPSVFAVKAVSQLPLVKKPSPIDGTNTHAEELREHLPDWRRWFQEIKDGKRTFRFDGDPTEYDLNGPAPSQKLAQIARDKRRDSERAERHDAASASGTQSPDAHTNSPRPSAGMSTTLLAARGAGGRDIGLVFPPEAGFR